VVRLAVPRIAELKAEAPNLRIEVSGKRGIAAFKFRKIEVQQTYTQFEDQPKFDEVEIIANRYLEPRGFSGGVLAIEHPSGRIEVDLVTDCSGAVPVVERASFVRTARRIFEGHVYVPAALFE